MSKRVRIHLEKAILVGNLDHQRYAKVLVGEPNATSDTAIGRSVSRSFIISGYIFSYRYHKLPAPTRYDLADANILAVSDYLDVPVGYVERNAHEFLARQLFAVPDSKPLTPQQYDDAKKISLGLTYGMREADLAKMLKRPVHQVEALLDRYLSFLGIDSIDRAGPRHADHPVKACGRQFWHGEHRYQEPGGSPDSWCPGQSNPTRQCGLGVPHEMHRFQEPGGSPDFQCPGQSYPTKQCPKQFRHGKHNYRTPVVSMTCLGQE